jgi:hypothetical protein
VVLVPVRIQRGLRDSSFWEDVDPISLTESAGRVRHGLLEDTAPPIGRDDLTGMEEFAVGSEYTQMIEKSCQMMTRGAEERQKTDGLVNIMSWAPDTQRVVRWFMKYFHSSHTKSLRGQTGEHREKKKLGLHTGMMDQSCRERQGTVSFRGVRLGHYRPSTLKATYQRIVHSA